MHVLALDDNATKVLLALIGLVPSTIAAVLAFLVRRDVRTPSGARIGVVAEQTHELTSANTALSVGIHNAVGASGPVPTAATTAANGAQAEADAAPSS